MIRVVEIHGVKNHSRMISEKRHHWKIRIQSTVKAGKPGRRKKSDLPIDQQNTSKRNETPVRWIEIDPNITWTRRITVRQPDYMLLDQSRNAKNLTSRVEALRSLCELPLPGQTNDRLALNRLHDVLESDRENIFVRVQAVECLRRWQNAHAPSTSINGNWPGLSHLMHFKSVANWVDEYDTITPNDFKDLNNYILKLFVPIAVSGVRARDGCSPDEALNFIVELLQNNDNTSNPYSDDEYVSTLVKSMSRSYCTNKKRLSRIGLVDDNEDEDEDVDLPVSELRRVFGFYMNIRSSHNRVVEIACIKAMSRMQKARLMSWKTDFTHLAAPFDERGESNSILLRKAALSSSIELYLDPRNPGDGWRLAFRWFASLLLEDNLEECIESHMWATLLRMIRRALVHEQSLTALHDVCPDTRKTVTELWNLMTRSSFRPIRRLCSYVLYRLVFDKGTPPCFFVRSRSNLNRNQNISDDILLMSKDCDVIVDPSNKRMDVNRIRRLQWLANAERERPPEIYVPRLKVIRLLDGTYRMARVSEQMIQKQKERTKKREEKTKKAEVAKLKKRVKKGHLRFKIKAPKKID